MKIVSTIFLFLGECVFVLLCGRTSSVVTVGVGVGFKFIKWTPPFPPGGRSAQEEKRLILRPLPLPNPKGHVANAFWKEREITASVLSRCFLLTVRIPTHTCANTHLNT